MLYVDSTQPEAVQEVFSWGVVRGVTTNPLIFAREAKSAHLGERIAALLAVSQGPVSVELIRSDEAGMVAEAQQYHRWDPARICIKVPFSRVGLKVTRALKEQQVTTNVTCIMNFNQAYLASQTGSDYISIFSGRVRDTGYDVRPTIRQTRHQFDREGIATRIIIGSIRHLMDVNEALLAGAHIVTAPPDILRSMLHHPKTDEAIAQFHDAWQSRGA